MNNPEPQSESGVILVTVLVLTGVLTLLIGSMMSSGHSAILSVRRWRIHDTALFKAQSVMAKAKYDIRASFKTCFDAAPAARLATKFSWFDTWGIDRIGSSAPYYAPRDAAAGDGYVATLSLLSVQNSGLGSRTLGLSVLVTAPDGQTRTIYEQVRYRLAPSTVFDYAYFVNNFGWFYGNTISAQGNVRANGNFAMQSDPKVNGDVTAAINPALSTAGTVTGTWRYDSLATYRSTSPATARPTDPPSDTYDGRWRQGYPGTAVQRQGNAVLDMPYIADLTDYEYLANTMGGQIKIGGTLVVDKVYSGNGPDGVAGTPDDGTIVLIGTSAKPIEITGPVVVRGDVIIKGVVTGQGTIYAKRNIHIANNITYKNPPGWTKPDNTPATTVTKNAAKDLLGLAAKGNIILGDYTNATWKSATDYYMSPAFTEPYATDASDADIGYDSDKNPATGYKFLADYRAADGGLKVTSKGNVARKYYESCNDVAFAATAPTTGITQIDAVLYTNHLLGGNTGSITFNGAIIARDEGIIFSGAINMNWDIRIGSESPDGVNIDIYLPRTLQSPQTLYWREVRP